MAPELGEGREEKARGLPEAIGKGPRAFLGEGFGREKVSPGGLLATRSSPRVTFSVPYGGQPVKWSLGFWDSGDQVAITPV